jgi:hypothetical protein
MAKKQTKLDTIVGFTNLIKEEPRGNKGVLSKEFLTEKNEKVKERYNVYINAVKDFKKARDILMMVKTDLQNILDTPLFEAGKISQKTFWDFSVDKLGNVFCRDEPKSYKDKFSNYVKRSQGQALFDDKDISLDWIDKDTPDPVKFPSEDTPQGTPEDTPSAEAIEEYMKKKAQDTPKEGDVIPPDTTAQSKKGRFNMR